jgi:hypothetical protein
MPTSSTGRFSRQRLTHQGLSPVEVFFALTKSPTFIDNLQMTAFLRQCYFFMCPQDFNVSVAYPLTDFGD